MISLFEYFDNAWEMTVFPQPKAPGIAVVPPCTHLDVYQKGADKAYMKEDLTEIGHPKSFVQ